MKLILFQSEREPPLRVDVMSGPKFAWRFKVLIWRRVHLIWRRIPLAINQAGDEARAKAVIYVDHGDV